MKLVGDVREGRGVSQYHCVDKLKNEVRGQTFLWLCVQWSYQTQGLFRDEKEWCQNRNAGWMCGVEWSSFTIGRLSVIQAVSLYINLYHAELFHILEDRSTQITVAKETNQYNLNYMQHSSPHAKAWSKFRIVFFVTNPRLIIVLISDYFCNFTSKFLIISDLRKRFMGANNFTTCCMCLCKKKCWKCCLIPRNEEECNARGDAATTALYTSENMLIRLGAQGCENLCTHTFFYH